MRWWVVALAAALALPARADPLEYQVKTEFVERFTRFIEWPAESFPTASAPFVLCTLGNEPVESFLEALARARMIKGRKITQRHVKSLDELNACHLSFIAGSEERRLPEIVARTSGKPILTVADSEGFAGKGVLINLYVDEEGHVRFEINNEAVKRSKLKFSSQLLNLARPKSP